MLKRMRCAIAVWCWVPNVLWIQSGAIITAFVSRPPSMSTRSSKSTQRAKRSRTLQSKAVYAWVEADDGLGVVKNWDRDMDHADLLDRMETHQNTSVEYNNKYSNKPPSKDSLTQRRNDTEIKTRLRKREESHRRRRGFRMPRASGATSDGVCFSIPTNHNEKQKDHTVLASNTSTQSQPTSFGWYLTIDKSTGLQIPLNISIPPATRELTFDTSAVARQKAELAFRVRNIPLLNESSIDASNITKRKMTRRETRIRQLALLLNVPIASSRNMIRRVPSLEYMDIHRLASKCVEISILLQCTPSKFASIVRHCPTLLTYRVDTLTTKLVQLDRLLSTETAVDKSGKEETKSNATDLSSSIDSATISGPPLCDNESSMLDRNVSESTLSIARRVPQLLASNIPDTLGSRSSLLRELLLLGKNHDSTENRNAFARVLKRCPELLLYKVDTSIARKLSELNTLFVQKEGGSLIDRNLGVKLALKEPRLLLYDVGKSLALKARVWGDRVDDIDSFMQLLAEYPTLFMYSLGAASRLEYFEYRNMRKPDASEARQLLMLSKKGSIESWGKDGNNGCRFDSTPALLGGIVTKRGRPRQGESSLDAWNRRGSRQSCSEKGLGELKVGQLRKLLKDIGGTPGSKRKSQVISELHNFGYTSEIKLKKTQDDIDNRLLLSYSEWMSIKLSISYPQLLGHDSQSNATPSAGEFTTRTVGELEKWYGMTLKQTKTTTTKIKPCSERPDFRERKSNKTIVRFTIPEATSRAMQGRP